MTDQATGKPEDYILELRFDPTQITQSLQYSLLRKKNRNKVPLNPKGKNAGTFNFNEDDTVEIQVVAIVEDYPDFEISINDCTLVSIQPPIDQPLSLFNPNNACTTVTSWSLPAKEPGNESTITLSGSPVLTVNAPYGQWQMSGYLSITFDLGAKTGSDPSFLELPKTRLYYFDPETSAGSGAGAGPPQVSTWD